MIRRRDRWRLVVESSSWTKRAVNESPVIQSVWDSGVVESRFAVENARRNDRDSVSTSPGESMAIESDWIVYSAEIVWGRLESPQANVCWSSLLAIMSWIVSAWSLQSAHLAIPCPRA